MKVNKSLDSIGILSLFVAMISLVVFAALSAPTTQAPSQVVRMETITVYAKREATYMPSNYIQRLDKIEVTSSKI